MSAARESHSPAAPDRSSSRRRSTGASEAADQIKVICRFRPPALPQAGAKNQVRSVRNASILICIYMKRIIVSHHQKKLFLIASVLQLIFYLLYNFDHMPEQKNG